VAPYYSAPALVRRFEGPSVSGPSQVRRLTVMRFALIIAALRLARLRVNAGTLTIEEWQEIR